MRNFSLISVLSMLLSASAYAADPSASPAQDFGTVADLRLQRSDWSGFNAVVFGGGGFLSGSDSLGNNSFFRSGLVGGSLGVDQQFDRIVFGVSVEGALTNFRGSSASGNTRQTSNWVGSATARLGYDAGRFMPYVTAGMGFGNYKIERKSNGASDENTFVGLVGGAGAEARITDGLFAKFDYKHYAFGEKTYNVSGLNSFTVDGKSDLFYLGIGYRF